MFVVTVLGKVRIGKVKGVSKELVSKYGKFFSTDFDVNKKLVYQYSDITNKRLNNHVAGYVTRLKVNEKKRADAEAAEEAEMVQEDGGTVETAEAAKAAGAAETPEEVVAEAGAEEAEAEADAEAEEGEVAEDVTAKSADADKEKETKAD